MTGVLSVEIELLNKYEVEFKKITGKELHHVVLKRAEIQRLLNNKNAHSITIPRLLEIVNEEIPGFLVEQYPTIVTTYRKAELSRLKFVFTQVAIELGYSRNTVIDTLHVDHTTVMNHLLRVKDALSMPNMNPELLKIYHLISDKIKKENARIIQGNLFEQPDTKPDVSTILHPGSITSRED